MDNYYLKLNKLFFYPDKLLNESKNIQWAPFEKATGKTGNFFDRVEEWLIGKVEDVEQFPEVERIHRILEYVTESKDIRPRFYRQQKEFKVPAHKDLNTTCAVNLLISANPGPMLNLQQEHSVKPSEGERILLKYSIFDTTYKECRDRLNIFT